MCNKGNDGGKVVDIKILRDMELRDRICRNNDFSAFSALVEALYPDYLAFTAKRVYDKSRSEDILNTFWSDIIAKRTICNYEGRDGSSLEHYLKKSLLYHIYTANTEHKNYKSHIVLISEGIKRDEDREKSDFEILDEIINPQKVKINKGQHKKYPSEEGKAKNNPDLDTEETKIYVPVQQNTPSQEDTLFQKERKKNIRNALVRLKKESPTDGIYIDLYYWGHLKYYEIAKKLLGDTATKKEIDKKASSIKKQMSRDGTGSRVRFKKILSDFGIDKYDIL